MTRDLFRRYVWLVDTIKNGGKMTFEEISHAWDISSFNLDNSKLALRTFHNHRDAVNSLFGIKILCNRSDHNYYIDESTKERTDLKLWMLQYLSIMPLVKEEAKDVIQRMMMDECPEQKYGIITLIDAMKKGRTIQFSYPSNEGTASVEVEPYALRFYDSTWYVLGKNPSGEEFGMYGLPLISDLKITKNKFKFPTGFSTTGFMGRFAGLDINSKSPEANMQLKVAGITREKIKTKPLHLSQKEVQASDDYSVFEITAVPTDDFLSKLIGMGPDVEILQPEYLRKSMADKIDQLAKIYR